ncbi:MAG: recombinase family protein [Eubacterium sp.]|nr:recombinase family protein [Eubacterium sp.]
MVNDMVIAKYIRLSSEDFDVDSGEKEESVSVTSQRQLIENYISEHREFENVPVKEFVDDGFSGTNFDRPAFQRMMEEARQGKLSVIIVKDLSRFGRDHLGVGNYLERILPIMQIRLIAVNDGYDSASLDGMTGGMSVALHNIINAMYSRDLSSKVKSAQRTRAEKGEYIASMPTFGYIKDPADKHHLIVDEEAAAIVKLIFELVASGRMKKDIVAYLNNSKIPTPSEYKASHGIRKLASTYSGTRVWDNATINYIIRNECYIGVTVWNKSGLMRPGSRKQIKKDKSEWIRVEGTHEPIVSEELFNKANDVIVKNRKNRTDVKKPVTRKALFICPYCNHALRQTTKKKSYVCKGASCSGIEGCASLRVEASVIENAVVSLVNAMAEIVETNAAKKIAHGNTNTSMSEKDILNKLEQFEQEHLRIKSEKLKLYTDYRCERLSKSDYLSAYEKITGKDAGLNDEADRLRLKLEELQKEQNISASEADKIKEVAALKEFDKAKLLTVIDKVLVYDNEHIEIKWKCNDWN